LNQLGGVGTTVNNPDLSMESDCTLKTDTSQILGGKVYGGGGTVVCDGGISTFDGVDFRGASVIMQDTDTLVVKDMTCQDVDFQLADTGASASTLMKIDGNVLLDGTSGGVRFTTIYNNTLGYTNGTDMLTTEANQTISATGRGTFQAPLTSRGLIDVNGSNGQLILRTTAKTNEGQIRVRNEGTLAVTGITLDNTPGSTIAIESGGTLHLNDYGGVGTTLNTPDLSMESDCTLKMDTSQIVGGKLYGGGGTVRCDGGVSTFAGVDFRGASVIMQDGDTLVVKDTTCQDVDFQVADLGYGASALMKIDGNVVLDGTAGGVRFTTINSNTLDYTSGTDMLTTEGGQTISATGKGIFKAPLTSRGLIDVSGSNGQLILRTAAKTNEGQVRVRNGGTLTVAGTTLNNTPGSTIAVESGGTLFLDYSGGAATLNTPDLTMESDCTLKTDMSQIVGGKVDGGGGTVVCTGENSTLDGVDLRNAAVIIQDADTLVLTGGTTAKGVSFRVVDLGYGGSAHLTLDGSLTLEQGSGLYFGTNQSNTCDRANASDLLTVDNTSQIGVWTGCRGNLRVNTLNHGDMIINGVLRMISGRTLTNAPDGTIKGNGTLMLNGATFVNQGTMAPGASAGNLDWVGNYSQTDTAALLIEIGGYTLGDEYDRLAIDGSAILDGVLDVDLIGGFTPDAGEIFTVLTATGGVTDNGLELAAEDASAWLLAVNAANVQVEYVPEPSTLGLLLVGFAAAGLACRRRRTETRRDARQRPQF